MSRKKAEYFQAVGLLGIFLFVSGAVGAIDVGQIRTATGISSGLCALVACDDGSGAAELASTGKLLVHCLELEAQKADAARDIIRAKGAYGFASVMKVSAVKQLPYADNLVNLLVVDSDALGSQGPSAAEIDRVVTPKCVAYVKTNGSWQKRVKAMPSGYDEWRMQNHGPDNNPVSSDTVVKLPTSVKWMAWYGNYSNNGEGLHGPLYYEIRIAGGNAFQHFRFKNVSLNIEQYPIDARDAFNGVAKWQLLPSIPKTSRGFCPLLAQGDRFFTVLKPLGNLVELDANTGKLVRTFDKAGVINQYQQSIYPVWTGSSIVQGATNKLVRFNPDNGEIVWEYSEGTVAIAYPTVAESKNKVYALVGINEEGAGAGQGGFGKRHPYMKTAAVVCLDLATGRRLWRTPISQPNHRFTQISYADGVLGLYAAYTATTGTGDSSTNFMGALDPDDGHWLWKGDARMGLAEKWSMAGNAPLYFALRDGHFFNLFKQKYYDLDAKTGARLTDVIANVPNNRCLRPFLTPNYVVMGFGIYVKRSLDWCFTNIARSTCGSAGFPAYGQIFNGPDGECGCFTRLKCATTLSCEVLRGDASDSSRLEKGSASAPSNAGSTVVQTDSVPRSFFPTRKPVYTGNPILDDWNNNDYLPTKETYSVSLGDKAFVGIVNEHRMECRQGSTVVWRFTAGGRISNPPVLAAGLCIFGSHDGYVYAVRQDNGAMVWRFLAARNDRLMCAFSQLESSHPVFGVIMNNGTVCASAGRHPEVDGGILVWGLNPSTGKIVYKTLIRTDHPWVNLKSKIYDTYKNGIVNGVLSSSGEFLKLPGITFDPHNPIALPLSTKQIRASGLSVGYKVCMTRSGIEVDFGTGAATTTMELYSINGQKFMTHTQYSGSSCLLPLENVSSGRYVLVLRDANNSILGRVAVLRK